jgi:hypothetical protein
MEQNAEMVSYFDAAFSETFIAGVQGTAEQTRTLFKKLS